MNISKMLMVCALGFLQGCFLLASAQDAKQLGFTETFGAKTATSVAASYSPTSQHILIGSAQGRKFTQAEIGYEYNLKNWSQIKIAYQGSIIPLFLESDPVVDGVSSSNASGQPTVILYPKPSRPVDISTSEYITVPTSTGDTLVFGQTIYGPRETTYAFAALPVGARVSALPNSRIQPTFTVNLGCLYAARNIPVDDTSSFNFLAYTGPGIEIFWNRKNSLRFEYLYEHLSNASLGHTNPGVDSATFRFTFIKYH